MSERHHSKVLIVGAGPAGYTAAIYAARANLAPLLVTGMQPGGQLTITTDVENYPGFADVIQGPWLMEQMQRQAEHVGTRIILDMIESVDLGRRPFVATGDSGDFYVGDTLILATGAQARWLGLPSEELFRGFGRLGLRHLRRVFLPRQGGRGGRRRQYRGRGGALPDEPCAPGHPGPSPRCVAGGKDPAGAAVPPPQDRHHLGRRGRRDPRRARAAAGDRGAACASCTPARCSIIACDGVFIAIGHTPVTGLVAGQLPLDPEGYVIARPDSTETEVPGVFAAGDVKDKIFRQAVTAAGMGCMAALEAEKFLAAREGDATMRAAD